MAANSDFNPAFHDPFLLAIQNESKKFQDYYLWIEQSMPSIFFEEVNKENIMLITHSLMGFELQDYFSSIRIKNAAFALCLDSADADLRILKNYEFYGIKNYQSYVSKTPPPFPGVTAKLRIATIHFTEAIEAIDASFPREYKEELKAITKQKNPHLTNEEFDRLLLGFNTRFLRTVPKDLLVLAFEMFFRAKTRDSCQYEVRYNEDWGEKGSPSMQIVLAWKNTPKYHFLYRLARTIHRYGLVMKRVNATYIDPYKRESILVMVLGLHGSNGKAAWEVADLVDFLRDLLTVKYFASFDSIDQILVNKGFVSGNMGNFLRAAINFIHQALVHIDSNLYTLSNIEEALCRHPELTAQLCEAFKFKFDPNHYHFEQYLKVRERYLADVGKLDTGQEENDTRRKNVLRQGMNFVHYTLKTNFFRINYTSLGFRLNPAYLDEIPFDRQKKFPELPYAIFFIKGMHFFGFHIRFKDLARGGLRTVYPAHPEHIAYERNNIFTECYHLAFTQHMKNKDIPEGGAKGIVFLEPYERLEAESVVLKMELEASKIPQDEMERKIEDFRKEQKIEYLYQAQRSFIETLITLVNCDSDGTIRAKSIIDYWKRPEYIYLGPDENMHDEMITWIANFSKKYNYKPGGAFISSKPRYGINHKEYGVTSLGVNVYMETVLKYLSINPKKDPFTVKMSGGPDGDVAGNQILNLKRFYPETAKLLGLIDISGTIYDPMGLDLTLLSDLFKKGQPIKFYPPEKLHDEGFLLDKSIKRSPTPFVQQTLCWRKVKGKLVEDWLSGSDMNYILRNNIHQMKTDVFIPAGGRPRTLNETNIKEFLDETGKPTARCIIEGANLYITPKGRRLLEKAGVLIVKDSSANKTGVICSSFEVLCGLALGDEQFLANKEVLVEEILERLKECAQNEANLLLRTHGESNDFLTDISDQISERINQFTYQILDYLEGVSWQNDLSNPLVQSYLNYCLPTLRTNYQKQMLEEIPVHHKKAIIACHIAAQIVYKKGLRWFPTIVEILPILLNEYGSRS